MRNIAVIAPEQHAPFIEGIQKSAQATIKTLTELGFTVPVFSQQSYGEKSSNIAYVFSANRYRIIKYLSWFVSAGATARKILSGKPEKILVFSLDWSFLPSLRALLKRSSGTNVVILIFSARELSGPARQFIRKYASNPHLRFWCFSSWLKEQVEKEGVATDRISTGMVFFTQPEKQTPRKTSDCLRIAYMSSGEKDAGSETMLVIASRFPEAKVTLAVRDFGERGRSQNSEFLDRASQLENITIERNIGDIPEFLSRQDVVILPPKNEKATMAIPLVALEAAYAGCSVLTADIPSLRELETKGIAKIFHDEDSLLRLLEQEAKTNKAEVPKALSGEALTVKEFVERITML